jgi:hypothetical protein
MSTLTVPFLESHFLFLFVTEVILRNTQKTPFLHFGRRWKQEAKESKPTSRLIRVRVRVRVRVGLVLVLVLA